MGQQAHENMKNSKFCFQGDLKTPNLKFFVCSWGDRKTQHQRRKSQRAPWELKSTFNQKTDI